MARSGRHRRGTGTGDTTPLRPSSAGWGSAGSGPAPPGWLPSRRAPSGVEPVAPQEPDLVVDVRHLLRVGGPLDLLATGSSMVSIVDPRTIDPLVHPRPGVGPGGSPDELELETILQSFLEVEVPESTALLVALAELAPDAGARARARAEVARRRDRLPAWVDQLSRARPYRAVLVSHVRGMADNVLVGVRLPPGHEISVSVYIDHAEGTVVADCVALPASLADVVAKLRSVVDELGTSFDDLALPDARARITRAVDNGATAHPSVETEDWPLFRPLVEWVTRLVADHEIDGS